MSTGNNPAAIISAAITNYDGSDPNDADNAARRVQLLLFLQFINDYIHNFREWEWLYTETTFNVVAANNSVSLATAIPTFNGFGRQGSLFDSTGVQYHEKSKLIVQRTRRLSLGAVYRIFAVYDGKIQFTFTFSSTTSFTAFHKKQPQSLADNGTALYTPDRYTDLVFVPALVWRLQHSKNDARADWAAMLRDSLSLMVANERPLQTAVQQLPISHRGAW